MLIVNCQSLALMPQHIVNLKNKKKYFIIPKSQSENSNLQKESEIEIRKEIPSYYISWEAPEYLHFEKTRAWSLTLFAIGLALGAIFVAMSNYSGAVVIALAVFVVYLFGHRIPKYLDHKITPIGIDIGGRIFLFDDLQSFWILYHPPVKELILRSKKTLMPLIHLQLDYADPNKIRDVLLDFLPEKEEEEPLSHIIAHLLKF